MLLEEYLYHLTYDIDSEVVEGDIANLKKSQMTTYTFNAPGISRNFSVYNIVNVGAKLKIANDKLYKYDAYITNYYIKGDAVSLFGESIGKVKGFKNPTKKNAHKLSNFNTIKKY